MRRHRTNDMLAALMMIWPLGGGGGMEHNYFESVGLSLITFLL